MRLCLHLSLVWLGFHVNGWIVDRHLNVRSSYVHELFYWMEDIMQGQGPSSYLLCESILHMCILVLLLLCQVLFVVLRVFHLQAISYGKYRLP